MATGTLLAIACSAVLLLRGAPLLWSCLALLVAGAGVAAKLVVMLTLTQRDAARLSQLRDVACEIGLGDLTVRAPDEPADDVGQMGLALNAMADRVSRVLQAQRDLLAGVSHELRSPLARIEVALELIRIELTGARKHAPDGVDRRQNAGEQLLGEVHEEVVLLERHIERLMEAQRIGVDRVLMVRKELSLDDMVGTVMRREKHRLEQLGFSVELVLDSKRAVLFGDENALDRVVSTLVENAVQHAQGPATADGTALRALRIETGRDESHAIVRVMDRGPGLTSEECQRVFEAFYRTDRSRNANTGGTGLGLYLVKRIAEAHGGTARAVPREGGGLSIELRLPVQGGRDLQKATVRMQAFHA